MRRGKITTILACMVYLVSCTDFTDEMPAETDAYVRYFQETNENYGVDIQRLSDGNLLLLGIVVQPSDSSKRTVLIKTDAFGNIITGWPTQYANFEGKSLVVDETGYFIIGDGINAGTDPTSMKLLVTNTQGQEQYSIEVTASEVPGISTTSDLHGTGFYTSGDAVGLGYIEDNGSLTELRVGYDLQTQTILWTITSSGGADYRPGRAILPSGDGHTWTTTREANGDSVLVQFARPNQSPGNSSIFDGDIAVDMTPLLGGFAGIGTSAGQILVYTTDANGNKISENSIDTETETAQATAQAISSTSSGFVIVLGSATPTGRTDTDFVVIKMNATGGNIQINSLVGGTGDETGGGAVDMPDGGVAIFGTSDYQGVKSMILIKTNKDGTLKI